MRLELYNSIVTEATFAFAVDDIAISKQLSENFSGSVSGAAGPQTPW